MSVLLFILGVLVAASGVIAAGFGIQLNEFPIGTAMISAGVAGLTGGFVLIGLSAVVGELVRLREALKAPIQAHEGPEELNKMAPAPVSMPVTASAPRPPTPNLAFPPRSRTEAPDREARQPAFAAPSPSSVDVSAAAIERLRSTIPRPDGPRAEPAGPGYGDQAPLSPNGVNTAQRGAAPESAPSEPTIGAQARSDSAVDVLKASRLDFLFRSKPARSSAETSDWQERPGRAPIPAVEPSSAPQALDRRAGAGAAPLPQSRSNPPPPEGPDSPAILKSGVVDGMAYTLYADGSIEAKLPQGMVRFGSVAELRAHIENNS